MTNPNFSFGIYNPEDVTPGYFGTQEIQQEQDPAPVETSLEKLTRLGIVEAPVEEKTGLSKLVSESIAVEEPVEDISGLDVGVQAGEKIREVGEALKVESKFEIDPSESETLEGSFKNNLKTLANAGRFAINIPGDTIQFVGDIVGLVSDPIGTLTAVKDVAVGVADKIGLVEGTEEQRAVVDAIGAALEENFGTGEAALETITQNPIDALFGVFGGASAAKAGVQATAFGKTAAGVQVIKRLDTLQDITNPLNAVKTELLAAQKVVKAVPGIAEAAVTAPIKATAATIRGVTPKSISKAIAGVDDIESASLAKITQTQFDDLINVAERATKQLDAPTPFELAGNKAIGALDEIKVQKTLAGQAKSQALAKVADNVLDTKPIIDKFDDLLADRFNVRVLDDGTLAGVQGKIPKNVDELQKFADQLAELRTAPQGKVNLGNLDALVDNLQDSINFAKLQRPGAATTTVEKTIAGFTEGVVNKTLKDAAGSKFIKANDDFRKAANLATDLEKALGGAAGDRAGSLFKSVFSPQAGTKTKRIFKEVRELTGTDLFDEAALAKFAMEAVGDTRGLSLLDAAIGGATTGIVPPLSIQKALQTVFKPTTVGRGLTIPEASKLATKIEQGKKFTQAEVTKFTSALQEGGGAEIVDKIADAVGARAKFLGDTRTNLFDFTGIKRAQPRTQLGQPAAALALKADDIKAATAIIDDITAGNIDDVIKALNKPGNKALRDIVVRVESPSVKEMIVRGLGNAVDDIAIKTGVRADILGDILFRAIEAPLEMTIGNVLDAMLGVKSSSTIGTIGNIPGGVKAASKFGQKAKGATQGAVGAAGGGGGAIPGIPKANLAEIKAGLSKAAGISEISSGLKSGITTTKSITDIR